MPWSIFSISTARTLPASQTAWRLAEALSAVTLPFVVTESCRPAFKATTGILVSISATSLIEFRTLSTFVTGGQKAHILRYRIIEPWFKKVHDVRSSLAKGGCPGKPSDAWQMLPPSMLNT